MIYTVPRDVNNASGMLQYQSTVVDDTSQTVQFTFSFSIYMSNFVCVFMSVLDDSKSSKHCT